MSVRLFRRFLRDQSGATAIEYAILGTLIAVALAATFGALGGTVGNLFNHGGTTEILNQQSNKIN